MVMPFSDCARIYIQRRHLYILQAVKFFYNFMFHIKTIELLFYLITLERVIWIISVETEQTVILKKKIKKHK